MQVRSVSLAKEPEPAEEIRWPSAATAREQATESHLRFWEKERAQEVASRWQPVETGRARAAEIRSLFSAKEPAPAAGNHLPF